MYLEDGALIGIELKAHGSHHAVKHLREQCNWLMTFPAMGCFCDSLEMFQKIIMGNRFAGISPYLVWDKLVEAKTASVDWDKLVAAI
jgi:hypothetical protein